MLTGMGHPLLSNSHSIISNPKSLFNMNNSTQSQWIKSGVEKEDMPQNQE